MIYCCGCKQLIKKRAGCLLTGRDSRGAWDSWELSRYHRFFCLPLYSAFIRSSATGGLLWSFRGVILSYSQYPLFLSPSFPYLLIERELALNSPCCSPSRRLVILFIPPSYLCLFLQRWAVSSHTFSLS